MQFIKVKSVYINREHIKGMTIQKENDTLLEADLLVDVGSEKPYIFTYPTQEEAEKMLKQLLTGSI